MEEFAKTKQSGLMLTLHNDIVVPYILAYGTEEVKKKYLPKCVSGECITAVAMTEPAVGSDLSGMETTAVEDGDEIIINGNKTFISNGHVSDLVIVAARNSEIDDPYSGISLYLVEDGTPGFERGEKFDKLGMRSQDTAELFFNNCRIPKENMLGTKGGGFIMLMEKLQQERLCAAIGGVIGSEMIIKELIEFCQKTIVDGRPLSKSQAIRFELVEMATEVKLGRTFMETLIYDHIDGQNVVVETSMLKSWATDLLNDHVNRALEVMGDYATLEESVLVRGFRDSRITTIFAGTNEIMKQVAAQFMGI
jgi:alkylation response protein AidB-like acyl-CoA dehydrogenase